MEPCLFRHGKCVPDPVHPSSVHASMEPCLFRHGKIFAAEPSEMRVVRASMEPCLFRHGKTVIRCHDPDVKRLQWSHVFSDMVRYSDAPGAGRPQRASMEPCLFRHGKW
ncbi:hypothetical protein BN140_3065 [Methanoculleus bourgensis MS2]|uniref:Uncharacterized protein n=2 Tax=Methanoculleus bourgensis TaxID=83986 RepID=W6PW50_METBM|nr:hypothetical protein BN140_3065 [Methanoculleus bourgensis MS2]CVK34483.1 protein of unknown function [Methanoculleus bourgensis]